MRTKKGSNCAGEVFRGDFESALRFVLALAEETQSNFLVHIVLEIGVLLQFPGDGIGLQKGFDHGLDRNVIEFAALPHILHMPLTFTIEGMVERIAATIEFERQQTELGTQFNVEGRRSLDPTSIEEDGCVTMPAEQICLHQLTHACGRKVIAHVRESKPRGNTDAA